MERILVHLRVKKQAFACVNILRIQLLIWAQVNKTEKQETWHYKAQPQVAKLLENGILSAAQIAKHHVVYHVLHVCGGRATPFAFEVNQGSWKLRSRGWN